jgi:predicted methyltransferase
MTLVLLLAAMGVFHGPAPLEAQNFLTILANPERPDSERALDATRKPEEVLTFYGVQPGSKVADIMAARGYYTAILSQLVGEKGLVYAVNNRYRKELEDRLKHPAYANVRRSDTLTLPADGSLDFALIHLNYHDLPAEGRAALNKAVLAALRPGGVYGIIDHSAKDGSGEQDTKSLHRIDKALVIKEATEAGFVLVREGDMLRRPEDTRDFSVVKERGKDDRFVLRFEKPK